MQNFFPCGFFVPQLGQSILGAEPTPRGSAVNENQSPRKEIVAYIDSYHRRPNSGLRYRTPAEVRPRQRQPAGQPPVGTDPLGDRRRRSQPRRQARPRRNQLRFVELDRSRLRQ